MFSVHVRRISTIFTGVNKMCNVLLSKTTESIAKNSRKVAAKTMDLVHGPSAYELTKDLDLEGKTCLITGGNSGIGLEIVRCLLSQNCDVMMACRNPYATLSVTQDLEDKHPYVEDKNSHLRVYEANLASLVSVKSFCDKVLRDERKIDIVILNAAIFGLPWTLTPDGIETTFQVNYLSQYYLLTRIENILSPKARVVWLSSDSHRNINWSSENILSPTEDLLSLPKDRYTSIRAYNVSKLCGLLSMRFMGYRWAKTSKSIFCASPGSFIRTKLCRNWWVYEFLYDAVKPFTKPITHAAATPLYCATSADLDGLSALYYKDCRPCGEGDMATDFMLAVKINELSRTIVQDRLASTVDIVSEVTAADCGEQKNDLEESLMSN